MYDKHNDDMSDCADIFKSASAPSPLDSDDVPREHSHAFPLRRRKSLPKALLILLGMCLSVFVLALASDFGILNFGTVVRGTMHSGTPIFDESFSVSEVRNVRVNLSTTHVAVREHDGDEMRIVFARPVGRNYIRPAYDFNNATSTLVIGIQDSTYRNPFFSLGLTNNAVLTIYIPKGRMLSQLRISTTYGDITINDVARMNDVFLDTDRGRISVENVQVRTIYPITRSGRLRLNDIQALNILTLSSTGRQDISYVSVRQELFITTSSGAVFLNHATSVNRAIVFSSTGNIAISHSRFDGELIVSATSGAIVLYNVDADMDRADITNDPDARISIE